MEIVVKPEETNGNVRKMSELQEIQKVVDTCQAFASALTSNNHDATEKEARLRQLAVPGARFDQMISLLKRENKVNANTLPMPVTQDDKPVLDPLTLLGGMVGQNGTGVVTKRPEPDGTLAYKVMVGDESHNAFLVISLPPNPKVMGISSDLLQQVTYKWFLQTQGVNQ